MELKRYVIGAVIGASGVIAVGALLAAAYYHERDGCKSTFYKTISPSGEYGASLEIRTCRWGFGFAAKTATVNLTKLGNHGWYYKIPLNYQGFYRDKGLHIPTIEWTQPNALLVHVYTHGLFGKLVGITGDLKVTRAYISVDQHETQR